MADNVHVPEVKDYATLERDVSSFYSELAITNCTNEVIVAIDKHGKHIELKPISASPCGVPCIRITTRSSIGWPGTRQHSAAKSLPKQPLMCGNDLVILHSDILTQPRYVKSIDMVFCTVADAKRTKHPAIAVTFQEALTKLTDIDARKYLNESMHISAFAEHSDPRFLEEHPNVYIYLFGKLISYPIRYNSAADGGYCRFVVYVGKTRVATLDSGIDNLAQGAKTVNLRGFVCVIATDEQSAYDESEKLYKTVNREAVELDIQEIRASILAEANDTVANAESQCKQQILLNNNACDVKMAGLNLKIASLQEDVQRLTSENERLKTLNNQLQAAAELFDRNRSRDMTLLREEYQTKRLQTASDTEKVKYDGVVWKIAGGVGIAVITAFLTYLGSRHK